MAYRTDINTSERSRAIALVIVIHAALLFAFLHLSGKIDLGEEQQSMSLFDFHKTPPPPPPPIVPQQSRAKLKEGGSAPKNIRSEATPVAAPKPMVVLPPIQQIAATETPRLGAAPTQGASDVRGPGTGAGGQGTGTGSGGSGQGAGGGDVAEPPHLVSPVLSGRDFSPDLIDQWPARATIFLRLRVDARGFVSECMVDRGAGVQAIDSVMCNLAHERLRFRPALNRSGQAVAGWFGYAQPAPR